MTAPRCPDPQERFVALYRAYQPQVLAYARRRLSEMDAQDVVADTFVVAWRQLGAAPPDPLPWLYRIAANATSNQRRRMLRWDRLQDRARAEPPIVAEPDPATGIGWADSLNAALSSLPEDDQEILRLAAWEELTGQELAAALRCSVPAARVRLHRARRRLARLLTADESTAEPPFRSTRIHPEVTP